MIDLNKYKGKIIAHRGIHNNEDTPENSLKAFKKAKENNYPIELDVKITKDNQLVIFHDSNLERMTGLNFNLEDFTLKALKELNLLNTNEKIPTLKEALELIDNKVLIDIEIKHTKRFKELCNILLEELNTYPGEIIISSFNPRIIKYIKNNSNYTCGLLIKNKTNHKIYDKISKTKLPILYSKSDFVAISKKIIDKYKTELPIFVWTIVSKEEIINNEYVYICNNLPYKELD